MIAAHGPLVSLEAAIRKMSVVSVPGIAVLCILSSFETFAYTAVATHTLGIQITLGIVGGSLFAGLVGSILAALTVIWGRAVIKKDGSGRAASLPPVFAIFILSGVAKSIVSSTICKWLGLATAGSIARLVVTGVGSLVWLSLLSWLVESHRQYRATKSELEYERAVLQSLNDASRASLEQARQQLAERIPVSMVDQLSTTITVLQSYRSLDDLPIDDLHNQAAKSRQFAEHVVRPISHQLQAQDQPEPSLPAAPDPVQKPSVWARMIRNVRRTGEAHPIRPAATAVLFCLSAMPIVIVNSSIGEIAGICAGFLISILVLAAGSGLLNSAALRRLDGLLRMAIAVIITVASAYLGVIVADPSWRHPPGQDRGIWFSPTLGPPWIIGLLASSLVCTALYANSEQRQENLRQLRIINTDISQNHKRLEQAIAAVQHQLVQIIHSDVQGLIYVAATQLDIAANNARPKTSAIPSQSAVSPQSPYESIDNALRCLREAEAKLQTLTGAGVAFPSGYTHRDLTELTRAWQGLIDITIDLSDAAASAIDASSPLAAAVMECAEEAVANAARHGQAKHVELTVELNNHNVQLVAVDDGRSPARKHSSETGIGLQMLDEAGAYWTLRQREDASGTVLTADFPLGAQPASPPPRTSGHLTDNSSHTDDCAGAPT